MHISLTGNLGSGKSTITKIMSEQYGYEVFSTGKILRQLAEERGISVLEMNHLAETDHSFDHVIDDTTRRISLEHTDDIFFDSRLAWNFAVNTFKVFLTVDINEAARRVLGDNRGAVETYTSAEDAREQLLARAHAEDFRYKDIYGLDYFKIANYDLMLDSTKASPETLSKIILSEKAKYEEAVSKGIAPAHRVLLSPARLLGSTDFADDNALIYESGAKVSMTIEGFDIVSGKDEIEKAFLGKYQFISVQNAD